MILRNAHRLVFLVTFLTFGSLAAATLELPHGKQNRLVSPDARWALYGVPYQNGQSGDPELWIENLETHRRRKVLDVPDTLRAGWFPDSTQFWVEDHRASDLTDAYIFGPATLHRLDIRQMVLSADPSIRRLDEGHRYYKVESAGAETLLIDFRGHTDEAPVACFDVRYRVTRAGAVRKLSARVGRCN